MHEFKSMDAMKETIARLLQKGFVRELGGGRAARYQQLIAPESESASASSSESSQASVSPNAPSPLPGASVAAPPSTSGDGELAERVGRLEEELAALKARFEELAEGLL